MAICEHCAIEVSIIPPPLITFIIGSGGVYDNTPEFDGEYTYTPTQNTQIIPIEGYKAKQDITINPIPSWYGLITWDGSIITVS